MEFHGIRLDNTCILTARKQHMLLSTVEPYSFKLRENGGGEEESSPASATVVLISKRVYVIMLH